MKSTWTNENERLLRSRRASATIRPVAAVRNVTLRSVVV